MLDELTTEIPFQGGLGQASEPELQTEGFSKVENCYANKDGALAKIQGFEVLTGGVESGLSSVLSGVFVPPEAQTLLASKVVTLNAAIGIASRGTLWVSRDDPAGKRLAQGYLSEWAADISTVATVQTAANFDSCSSGEYVYYATVDVTTTSGLGAVRVTSFSRTNGAPFADSATFGTGPISGVIVLPWNTNIGSAIAVFRDAGDLKWTRLAGGRTTGVGGVLVAGVGTEPFDACVDVANGVLLIAYGNGALVRMQRWNISSGSSVVLDVASSIAVGAPATGVGLCFDATGSRALMLVADWNASKQRVRATVLTVSPGSITNSAPLLVWESAVAASPGIATFDATCRTLSACVLESGTWFAVFHSPNQSNRGGTPNSCQFTAGQRVAADGSALVGSLAITYGIRACSRPYYDSDSIRVYFLAHLTRDSGLTTDPNRGVVIAGHPAATGDASEPSSSNRFVPFGSMGYLTAQVYGPEGGLNAGHFEQRANWWKTTDGALVLSWRDENNGVVAVRQAQLRKDNRVGIHRQFGAQTYIAGAMLWQWDGWRTFESQFIQQPVIDGPRYFVGGLAAGTRSYKVTFLRISHSGELTRSRPSDAVTFTNTAGNGNEVRFNRVRITACHSAGHFEELYYEVWRTKSGYASPYYLLQRIPYTAWLASGAPLSSWGLPDQHVLLDTVDDAQLLPEALAADGGAGAELANDPPPSALGLCEWANRLWVTNGEELWYSKERAPARSAEFSGFQALNKGALREAIVAIARNGETLAVFSPRETGYVFGEPAAANGQGSSLVGPVVSQGAVGCLHPYALVEVPTGIIVPTQFGVQLYTLGREYVNIGLQAEDELRDGIITSGTYEQSSDLAWLCATAGLVLFDVSRGTWSTYRVAAGVPSSIAQTKTRIVLGVNTGVYASQSLYQFGVYPYQQVIETPWLKAGGVAGEMRVRKLWLAMRRSQNTVSGVSIAFFYDYASSPHSTLNMSHAELLATESVGAVTMLRIQLPKQRCRSFKVKITEVTELDGSEGFTFLAMRLSFAQRKMRGTGVKRANSGSGV